MAPQAQSSTTAVSHQPTANNQHHEDAQMRRCAAAAVSATAALMSIMSARIAVGGAIDNCSVTDVAVTISVRVVGGVGDSW